MADALAALPFAALSIQSVYLKLWLALVYVLLLLYLLGRGEKKRPLVPLGLGTAGLCAALVLQAASHTAGRLTVSVLDVGQGLSAGAPPWWTAAAPGRTTPATPLPTTSSPWA